MLSDFVRTDGFRRAISKTVRPGNIVIDVGAGTGILGFFAASAGADKVILIEKTPSIERAKELAKVNGLTSKLSFFYGDASQFTSDVKANVIVSEWIGYFLLDEYMFGAFATVRDKYLAKDGKVIPASARLYLAPIESLQLYNDSGLGFWEAPVYGYDFSLFRKLQLDNLKPVLAVVDPRTIMADPWNLMKLDCAHDHIEAFHFTSSGEFLINRTGSIHGFIGYFDLDLGGGITLDTSPYSKTTHWQQVYFPTERLEVKAEDKLSVTFRSEPGSIRPSFAIEAMIYRGTEILHTVSYFYSGSSML